MLKQVCRTADHICHLSSFFFLVYWLLNQIAIWLRLGWRNQERKNGLQVWRNQPLRLTASKNQMVASPVTRIGTIDCFHRCSIEVPISNSQSNWLHNVNPKHVKRFSNSPHFLNLLVRIRTTNRIHGIFWHLIWTVNSPCFRWQENCRRTMCPVSQFGSEQNMN